jgi:UDP-N-acetylmuramyl pentapeptide phosphotransferase/UDP-N-acetylglucosamine-1-phosphate transferase
MQPFINPAFNPYLVLVLHLALAALLTYWVLKRGLALDAANERSSHTGSLPSAGGVGLVLSIIIGMAYLLPGNWPLIAGALLIGSVSLLDDIRSSSKRLRIAMQFTAALLIVFSAGLLNDANASMMLLSLIAIVWIVGMSNAFNFMDGLDGFAGSTAVVAGTSLSVIAYNLSIEPAFWLGALIAATSIGFLIFNWPPAKIFMGDVGSASLGFLFAAVAVVFAPELPWWVVPFLLLHFIVDTSFTMARRLLRGENITQAHRSHIYQLLNRTGWSHTRLAILTILLGALHGITAFGLLLLEESQQLVVMCSFVLVYFGFALYVSHRAKQQELL